MLLIPLYPVENSKAKTAGQSPESNARSGWQCSESKTMPGEQILEASTPVCAFIGEANRLSRSQVNYESIQEVYLAGCLSDDEYKSRHAESTDFGRRFLEAPEREEEIELRDTYYQPSAQAPAGKIIRTRRSAVEMDGMFRISLARLSRILIDSSRGFPSCYSILLPFQEAVKEAGFFVHIILYVHRVDGIAPGVYYFDRSALILSLLNESNVRSFAKFASCLQDIAADGVFAVSLIADMQSAFDRFCERAYRYIHQEAGFIGHLFYLTAHALDIDATGIGCFLDDEINQSMPKGMEVVYNFTFGRALQDPRLSNLPAYDFEAAD